MLSTLQRKPLVSVYIPTYNRLELLKRAVNSVIKQDYQNIEIIIVDDGSSDGTVEYLQDLSEKNLHIKHIINEKNSGACVSRNKAIMRATGELITGLDDDDYFLPERISSLVSAWQKKESTTVAVCSNSLILGANGKIKKTRRPRKITRFDLIDSNLIGNQVLTEKERIMSISGFDESLPAWQDLELWLRLLSATDSQVECLKKASYVLDISHPHERISTGRIEKINSACKYISKKHKLSDSEEKILSMQVLGYKFSPIKLRDLLFKISRNHSTANILHSSNLLLKTIIKSR